MEAGLVFWPAEWQHMLIYWFRKQLENSRWWWVCLVDPNKRVCVVSEDERLGPRPQGLCRPACLKIWFFENHIFFKLLWLPIHGVCGACCAHPQSPPWYHGGVDASLWYFGEIQMAQWHQRELLCQWVRLLLISWTFQFSQIQKFEAWVPRWWWTPSFQPRPLRKRLETLCHRVLFARLVEVISCEAQVNEGDNYSSPWPRRLDCYVRQFSR